MESSYGKSRFLEIIPGAITWTILLLPIILSVINPYLMAYFILIFIFYWFIKAIMMGFYLLSGYRHMKRSINIDWLERLKKLENINQFLVELEEEKKYLTGWRRKKAEEEILELDGLKERIHILKDWQKIHHFIILPLYKESFEILDTSVTAILGNDYPKHQVYIILAVEERAGKEAMGKALSLKEKYVHEFADFFIVVHPDNIVGELKAKGANINWALTHFLKQYLDRRQIPYDDALVSIFDSDTRPHHRYLAALTYKYVVCPNRNRRSFQPIPLYSNNIWDVPMINRLVAFGSSFWQMIESTRPYRLVNFSSQAMSFRLLFDIDFVDPTIVSEDSRHYYRAFFTFAGDHKTIPVFTPVHMDAVLAQGLWGTIKNQYYQKRRWAWGVEHIPYFILEARKHPEISGWEKFVQLLRLFEGHISWATASLLIAFALWPLFLFNPEFSKTVIGHNIPTVIRTLLVLTWGGIVISAVISTLLLPPRPQKYSRAKYLEMVFQWIFIPISAIFYGSIPAIDAQTRMMLGKYLGFWVTEKKFVK